MDTNACQFAIQKTDQHIKHSGQKQIGFAKAIFTAQRLQNGIFQMENYIYTAPLFSTRLV